MKVKIRCKDKDYFKPLDMNSIVKIIIGNHMIDFECESESGYLYMDEIDEVVIEDKLGDTIQEDIQFLYSFLQASMQVYKHRDNENYMILMKEIKERYNLKDE